MGIKTDEFNNYREKMNARLLGAENNKVIKRIFNVDTNAYLEGVLPVKTKEMLGLVSSLVLSLRRLYKVSPDKMQRNGMTEDELFEVLGIANLVGGTIVIPHTRRAVEFWDDLHN